MTEPVCTISKPRLQRLLLLLVILALVSVAWVYGKYRQFSHAHINLPQDEMIFSIKPGMSLGQLAHELHAQGIITHPRFFIHLGRQLQAARRLKAGEYPLNRELTPRSLLGLFTSGKVVQYTLTLVDGQTFSELRRRIEQHPALEQTLQGLTDSEVMERLGHPDQHPEGRFLADTYHFPRHTTDLDFLQRAYNAMQLTLQAAWETRDANLPLANPDEALILASIVEKETGIPEERAQIAGVFIRRLQRGMKLQTDPTVIYGMGESFDGNIRRSDLTRDTPYNTYTRGGLPPTPIATPGRAAIEAVMHPSDGNALFFVASGNGRHYFSDTLKEHNLAVDKFQRGKKGILLPKESGPR
jgi:UPF0755 protein